MTRPAGPAVLMAGSAKPTVLISGPAMQPTLVAGPTGLTALTTETTVVGSRGAFGACADEAWMALCDAAYHRGQLQGSAHWLVKLVDLRERVRPTRPKVLMAGQTKAGRLERLGQRRY